MSSIHCHNQDRMMDASAFSIFHIWPRPKTVLPTPTDTCPKESLEHIPKVNPSQNKPSQETQWPISQEFLNPITLTINTFQ